MITNPNWKARLASAQRTGKFTRSDRGMVKDFRTCAVGEKASYPHYPPLLLFEDTFHAYTLGCQFNNAVRHNNIDEAYMIYNSIQMLVLMPV